MLRLAGRRPNCPARQSGAIANLAMVVGPDAVADHRQRRQPGRKRAPSSRDPRGHAPPGPVSRQHAHASRSYLRERRIPRHRRNRRRASRPARPRSRRAGISTCKATARQLGDALMREARDRAADAAGRRPAGARSRPPRAGIARLAARPHRQRPHRAPTGPRVLCLPGTWCSWSTCRRWTGRCAAGCDQMGRAGGDRRQPRRARPWTCRGRMA